MSETKKLPLSVALKSEAYQQLLQNTLGDKKIAQTFIANILTAVGNNSELAECSNASIVSAGLMANSLNLSMSQTLGFCYVLPYKTFDKKTNTYVKKAQFVVGYKGLLQLAFRTGSYETIGVREVHKGEHIGLNEFGEDKFKFSHEFDNNEIIGYYAYFKLVNGFKKTMYWTKEQCEKHGKKYSKSYGKLWTESFDFMAQKTVLKQLISKYGIMSIELEKAVKFDQSVIENDQPIYVDNPMEDEPVKQVKNTILNDTEIEITENGEIKEA